MRDQFSNTQQVRKPAVVSKGGIVAAQSRKAAEVGAEALAAGAGAFAAIDRHMTARIPDSPAAFLR